MRTQQLDTIRKLAGRGSFGLASELYERYCDSMGTSSLQTPLQVEAVCVVAGALRVPDWYAVSPDLQPSVTELITTVGLEVLAALWNGHRSGAVMQSHGGGDGDDDGHARRRSKRLRSERS